MNRVINPFNKKSTDLDTTAHLCDCICNVQQDNKSSGIWTSRLTGDLACGCACNSTSSNKEANKSLDKNR